MFRKLLAILIFASLLLSACQSAAASTTSGVTGEKVQAEGGSYTDITAAELHSMLEHKDFTFVNVHTPFEGDIAGTDLSIPYDQVEQNLALLPADKNARIVLYCRSDRMSNIAAKTLVKLGYTNIWNLKGGMVAWQQAGYPLQGQ